MRPASCRITKDVDHILLNGFLRDELEGYDQDAMSLIDTGRLTTEKENEFLASMLAWERAPILPIAEWFDPPIETLSTLPVTDAEVTERLWRIIRQLHSRGIILECADHLSDRQLLATLYRDVLPSPEKRVKLPGYKVHWRFVDELEDPESWLRYYATSEERKEWAVSTGNALPPAEPTPFPRDLPT